MNRESYLQELKKYLKKLPHEDYVDAIDYFTEYFDEAGTENEQIVIKELGTPKQAASELLNQLVEKQTHAPVKTWSMKRTFWLALLAIFAAPIGIPLALTAILLLFSGILVLFSLLVALVSLLVADFLVAGKLILRGLVALPVSFSGGVSLIGLGALLIGIGLLVLPVVPTIWKITKGWSLNTVTRLTRKQVIRS